MSDCTEIQTLLSDYLDRDLPPDTCSAVEAHLASCDKCSAEATALRRTIAMCRDYRSEYRPGPLAPDKHQQMVALFQKVLTNLRSGSG
jgi:anti-sigma factor RsiW